MPTNAPSVKRVAVADFGARIYDCEPTQEARERTAAEVCERTGAVLIPPFDHPDVIAGQGTAGLEIAEQARLAGASTPEAKAQALLEITVYGRRAGRAAGQRAPEVTLGKLSLAHVDAWEKELAQAGIETDIESPILLPDYTRHVR